MLADIGRSYSGTNKINKKNQKKLLTKRKISGIIIYVVNQCGIV